MRNKIYALLIMLFSSGATFGQLPKWSWAKSAGGVYDDYGWGISTDVKGNIYATGHFYGADISFGDITLINSETNGSDDMFIVKYDASGNVIWAKSAGGAGNDGGQRISTDIHGNVFVTGDFNSSIIIFGNDTLSKGADKNIFVVKYDSSGNAIWAKSASGISTSNYGQGISTDAAGNVYITGAFESSNITFGDYTLINADTDGSDDVFVVKYDSSGNVIWAKSAGGPFYEWCDGICADDAGNIYIAGYFQSETIAFGNNILTNNEGNDIFIVKYDSAGNVIWAKSGSGISGYYGQRIAADAQGNVYVTGAFTSDKLIFDSIAVTNHASGLADIFVAKYDISGSIKWVTCIGGSKMDEAFGIATDDKGDAYITGYFNSPTISVANHNLNNSGTSGDIFIIKYDTAGNVVWAEKAGGNVDDNGLCIATDVRGNIYIAGDFKSPTITFGKETLTNAGNTYDFFVGKLEVK